MSCSAPTATDDQAMTIEEEMTTDPEHDDQAMTVEVDLRENAFGESLLKIIVLLNSSLGGTIC
jgi:hypothetical protein